MVPTLLLCLAQSCESARAANLLAHRRQPRQVSIHGAPVVNGSALNVGNITARLDNSLFPPSTTITFSSITIVLACYE